MNVNINVVGAEKPLQIKAVKFNDVKIDNDVKEDAVRFFDTFTQSKDLFVKNNLSYKQGMMITGAQGNRKGLFCKCFNYTRINVWLDSNNCNRSHNR